MTEAKSTQPQLPPRPERVTDESGFYTLHQADEADAYMNALEAKNESLKAQIDSEQKKSLLYEKTMFAMDSKITFAEAERDKAAREANQLRLAFVLSDSILPAEFEPELPPTKRLHVYIDKMLEVVREFYSRTGIIDDGKCAVCRHGYRSWKLPACRVPSGPCSNEDCLSRKADALLLRSRRRKCK